MICSVLINTAHRPEFLDRCLASYARQTRTDFEMVIADDGSDEATLAVVRKWRDAAPYPITHVWSPPAGHRRAEILNKGLSQCRGEHVIFSDCDSLAPARFVEEHLARRRPGRLLIGGRIKLTKARTESMTIEAVASGAFEEWITDRDRRKLARRHWKNIFEIWMRKKRRPHNLGLNMSLARADIEAVNGYDNNFRGWGNADGDLRERLKTIGVWPLSIWRQVYIFHQWHPQLPRGEGNADYAKRADVSPRAQNGLAEAARDYEQHDRAAYEAFVKAFETGGSDRR